MSIRLARAALPLLPTSAGFWLTRSLAGLVRSPPIRIADREVLNRAKEIQYGRSPQRVGWVWGEGPLVLLVHGWAGRAAQMVSLAQTLSERGFRVAAFDVTAHGASAGRAVNFRTFVDDLHLFAISLGEPPYAVIGHSAGGLAAAAARRLHNLRAEHFVFICAPRGPYIPIDEIRRLLEPPERIIERTKAYFAAQFESDWDSLDAAEMYLCTDDTPALLVFDQHDATLRRDDSHRIAAVWRRTEVLITSELGHTKALWSPVVIERVAAFLTRTAPWVPHATSV